MAGGVTIRPLRTGERWLLTEFLYEAVWRPDGAPPVPRTALQEAALRRYVEVFGRAADDRCLAAVCDGRVAGAVWVRRMHGFGHVDDATPELAVALYPEYRGRGIGTLLLRAMLELLRQEGCTQVSLSVQCENRAAAWYLREGFELLAERDGELVMVCRLG